MEQPMQDPMAKGMAAPMGEEMAEEGSMGYEICIKVSADGKISVGVIPGAPEAMEAEAEGAAYVPAENIKEALTMALDVFRADGQMPEGDQESADFNSGYTDRMPK